MDARSELAKRIKFLRDKGQLSQEELAHRAAIHVTYLSGLENGKRNPSLTILERLSSALGVTIGDLFK